MPENALTPTPEAIATPKLFEPVNPELPSTTISDKEADEAAKSLGMVHFSAAKSRKLKTLGLFQAQQGVVHLGVGRLAAADEALSTMIEAAVDLATDADGDEEVRVSALVAGRGLVEALQKSVEMMVSFQTEKLLGNPSGSRKRSFVDDSPVVPIQAQSGSTINVNVVDQQQVKP